ncbi:MAG: hypothetical protein M5U14_07220 [Acidimicrobiia bacterium]|nr:hypothetical protein [Acidimicrobiia bacterium]
MAQIVAARDEGGPFADFHDFCERVDPGALNKRTIESLVKAGVRLARPSPPGAARRVRADHRPGRGPAARARRRHHEPLRRGRRRR